MENKENKKRVKKTTFKDIMETPENSPAKAKELLENMRDSPHPIKGIKSRGKAQGPKKSKLTKTAGKTDAAVKKEAHVKAKNKLKAKTDSKTQVESESEAKPNTEDKDETHSQDETTDSDTEPETESTIRAESSDSDDDITLVLGEDSDGEMPPPKTTRVLRPRKENK